MQAELDEIYTLNNLTNINYNYINLPGSLINAGNPINYIYDAWGDKLRKTVGSSVNNDYIGGIHYEGGVFAFLQTEVGRVVKNGSGTDPLYSYEYTLTDHLGNGRVYFDIFNNAARKIQEDDYYAFGLPVSIGSIPPAENKYQYNGKEKQDQERMFDYGARFYDPVIGRWNVIDPLAESYLPFSPYNYVLNNPISNTDPDGMSVNTRYVTPDGKTIINTNDGRDDVYEVPWERVKEFKKNAYWSSRPNTGQADSKDGMTIGGINFHKQ